MRKRIITAALAASLAFSTLLSQVAFAVNPLKLTDRVTAQADAIRDKEQKIKENRAAQSSTHDALAYYGATSEDSQDFSQYINRKYMTKLEYEAFKWSFIFSQFAQPLEDSLLDVFDHWDGFKQLIDENRTIISVEDTLKTAGIEPQDPFFEATLSSVPFADIYDTISDNYTYMYLHTSAGNPVYLEDLIAQTNGGNTLNIFEPLYIWDTRLEVKDEKSDVANSILYNQWAIGSKDWQGKYEFLKQEPEQKEVAVFVMDAQSFFYMQLAVVACIRNNNQWHSVSDIRTTRGKDSVVIDSYGNICALHDSKPTILIPNFGNSFLISSEGEEKNTLNERIAMYNAWVTAFYSRSQRAGNTIYGDLITWDIQGEGNATLNNEGGFGTGSTGTAGDFYSSYLDAASTAGKLSGSIVLVEPSMAITLDTEGISEYLKKYPKVEEWAEDCYYIHDFAEGVAAVVLGAAGNTNDSVKNRHDLATQGWWLSAKSAYSSIVSPASIYDGKVYFVPFTCTDPELKNEYFINKYPLFTMEIQIATQNEKYTHYSRVGNMLDSGDWTFCSHEGSHSQITIYTDMEDVGNSATRALPAMSSCAILQTNFGPNEIIGNNLFQSWYHYDSSDGVARTIIPLPKAALDVGQNMGAFLSDEKGMFLADYEKHFVGDIKALKTNFGLAINRLEFQDVKLLHSSMGTWYDVWWADEEKGIYRLSLLGGDVLGSDKAGLIAFSVDVPVSVFKSEEFWKKVKKVIDDSGDGSEEGRKYQFRENDLGYVKGHLDELIKDEAVRVDFVDAITQYINANVNSQIKADDLGPGDKGGRTLVLPIAAICGLCSEQKSLSGVLNAMAEFAGIVYPEDSEARTTFINDVSYVAALIDPNFNNVSEGSQEKWGYYFDEYVYFLRNTASLEDTISCKNADDFAVPIYYWDRYYLMNTGFNLQLTDLVSSNYGDIEGMLGEYQNHLGESGITEFRMPLTDYVTKYGANHQLNKQFDRENPIYAPYYYEYQYQKQSFEDWLNAEPNFNTNQTVIAEPDEGQSESASKVTNGVVWQGKESAVYAWLDNSTIVIYPFGNGDYKKYKLLVHAGIGDRILSTYASTPGREIDADDYRVFEYNPLELILSLQKNTDYAHNTNIAAAYTHVSKPETVTTQDLMNKANQFFKNPVTSLQYILTGFLYKAHEKIALGDIGNVFSISWLLETDGYVWVIDRYIALTAIAVTVLLLLKLTQLAMSKSRDYGSIGRQFVGILAMCLVPLVIFNSFIWIFNKSSAWAMSNSCNKILLSQVDVQKGNANRDAAIDTEILAFKEQFADLSGTYRGATFEFISEYRVDTGPQYRQVPLSTLVDYTNYRTVDRMWYTGNEFTPVHADLYNDNLFYFFYDYIRSEYFDYCLKNDTNGYSGISSLIQQMGGISSGQLEVDKDARKKLNDLENSYKMLKTGGFRNMLLDTDYVYGVSLSEGSEVVFGGPVVKDLAGLYYVFGSAEGWNKDENGDNIVSIIQNSEYFKAYQNTNAMRTEDSIISKNWLEDDVVTRHLEDNPARDAAEGVYGQYYPTVTSKLDLVNPSLNPKADKVNSSNIEDALTPFEQKLCKLSDKIYEDTLKALNYMPEQIHDDAAVFMMALIATMDTNEMFGLEPSKPIMESITLDSVVRAAFVHDLDKVGGTSNTLYCMVMQGDSMGKIALVVILELVICVFSIMRVLLVLYITGATFVILALRLLHKAPRTTELAYGIVGNLIALLFLHVLTLFLVVISVEWIAGAVSAIPNLVMNIAMVLFAILAVKLLWSICKNIVKDAINLGGAKIREMVHSVSRGVVNAFGSIFNRGDESIQSTDVSIIANQIRATAGAPYPVDETRDAMHARIEAIVSSIMKVEAEYDLQRKYRDSAGGSSLHDSSIQASAERVDQQRQDFMGSGDSQ